MKMTPNLIPKADWILCAQGLPEPGKFVWIVVGKVLGSGLARRYLKEVHMGTWNEESRCFKIYPYRLPIVSTTVWAWAPMIPPTAPLTRSTEAIHRKGDEWKSDAEAPEPPDGDDEFEIEDYREPPYREPQDPSEDE
jgi:hypothetical protein